MTRKAPIAKSRKPMPRAKKPLPFRNTERRPAWRPSEQRDACMVRDLWRCQFEIVDSTFWDGAQSQNGPWRRCNAGEDATLQAAHVWRKPQIGDPETIDHPDVAIAACEHHHKRWDAYDRDGLRIPAAAIKRARDCINASRTGPNPAVRPIPDDVEP